MAYDIRNLSVLAYSNGFTHWFYRSRQPIAEVLGSGFFGPGLELLSAGDVIWISASDCVATFSIRYDRGKASLGKLVTDPAEALA